MKQQGFKIYYLLITLLCLVLLVAKLVATFWIPEWSPTVYAVLAVLGIFAIGKMLFQSIRLKMAEYRMRSELAPLPPLSYAVRKPPTLKDIAVHAASFVAIAFLVVSGAWYADVHHFLQQDKAKVCVSQPSPMPKIQNDVPPLTDWSKSGIATFTATQTDGLLKNPSLQISNTNGVAAWTYSPRPALAGETYQYADWYEANTPTALVIRYVLNGKTLYRTIDSDIPATRGWRHYSTTFSMPDNPGDSDTIPVMVMHQINRSGRLAISDVILHQQKSSFVRPMISLTFDDGFRGQFTNALPFLCRSHIPATFYLISSYIKMGYPDYMLPDMVSKLAESGMEIADHTVDHPHLPELSLTDVERELSDSKDYLEQFGPIVDFASPYGEVTNQDLQLTRQLYQSHRSTDIGLNTADAFDAYNIMCVTIDTQEGTSLQNIKHWIDLAIKTRTWLILAFHEVDGPGQKYFQNHDPYNASPEFLEEILSYIHTRQIQPMTVNEGLSEVYQQI